MLEQEKEGRYRIDLEDDEAKVKYMQEEVGTDLEGDESQKVPGIYLGGKVIQKIYQMEDTEKDRVEISQKKDMDDGSVKVKKEWDEYGSMKVGLRRKVKKRDV